MKIIKSIKRTKDAHEYLKVYFMHKNNIYCWKKEKNYITKKIFQRENFQSRPYSELYKKKRYDFITYENIYPDISFIEKFYEKYKEYLIEIRKEKLKRIL